MDKAELLLAVDLGTSGVKVGAFDLAGQLRAWAARGYATARCGTGRMEQDPHAWWTACAQAVKQVTAAIGTAHARAICVTGLAPSLVALDGQGQPVRPATIWSDRRADPEHEELVRRLGRDDFSGLLPRLLWLRRTEPSSYEKTRRVFQSFDYITFKLCGEACHILVPGKTAPLSASEAQATELDDRKFPKRVCRIGEVCGQITREVAIELDLPVGLPVVAGTVDAFAAWLGTASLEPGQLCNTVGTSTTVALVEERPRRDPQRCFGSIPHPAGEHWMIAAAMSSGCAFTDWFAQNFYSTDGLLQPVGSKRVQSPASAESLRQLTDEAAAAPAGADGLLALPYISGERSPIRDPHARGIFFGISINHTRAHIARSVLESVAFATRDLCDRMTDAGAIIREVRLAGPAANNRIWSQIRADVLGCRVIVPEAAESGLLGAAMLAGVGQGIFQDVRAAALQMARIQSVLEPNHEYQERYQRQFSSYRNLYRHLKEDFAQAEAASSGSPS